MTKWSKPCPPSSLLKQNITNTFLFLLKMFLHLAGGTEMPWGTLTFLNSRDLGFYTKYILHIVCFKYCNAKMINAKCLDYVQFKNKRAVTLFVVDYRLWQCFSTWGQDSWGLWEDFLGPPVLIFNVIWIEILSCGARKHTTLCIPGVVNLWAVDTVKETLRHFI